MNNCGIYCIENLLNNKKYIGQSEELDVRLAKHVWLLNKNKHDNRHLQGAFNIDGIDNFSFYVLEECECISKILDEKETYYMDLYKTLDPRFGYNIQLGGTKPPNRKGTKMPEKEIERLKSIRGKDHPSFGTHPSDESRNKMSLSHLGKSWWTLSTIEKASKRMVGNKYAQGYTPSKELIERRAKSTMKKKHKNASSRYFGVTWDKSKHKWAARIRYKGKMINLGRFDNEIDAAKARDSKCWELYHDIEMLNFPEKYK